jgi:hypothetical protein
MSLIKVIKTVGGQKKYGVEYEQDPTLHSVARLINSKLGSVAGFANMVLGSHKKHLEVQPHSIDVEPMIPAGKQNIAVLISGESDTGKSTMGALLLTQYLQMYPKRPMYFISQKKKAVDRNLSKIKELQQLSSEEIESFDINDYSDCLFLIDDSDFGKGKKQVMELLNLISTVGREQRISWIFISHNNSKINETNAFKEFQIYITYQNNLTNNRMLYQNMGFTTKQIEDFKEMNSTYYVFNRIYNVLITEYGVQKYS